MMETPIPHSQDFQYRRQKSIEAENNSQRQERTSKASSANHSRMRRRSSLELRGGKRRTMVVTGNSSNRKDRRTFSLDLQNEEQRGSSVASSGNPSNHSRRGNSMDNINESQRAVSPGKRVTRMRRRSSIERNRGGSNSRRRERQFVDASTFDESRPASFRMRRQRRNSMSNGVSPKRNSTSQRSVQNVTSGTPVINDLDTKPQPLCLVDRQWSGGNLRKSQSYRLGRRASSGMNGSQEAIPERTNHSARTNIRNVGAGMKPEPLRLEGRQSSGRSAHRLGRRASTGMGPEVNPVKPEPLRLEGRKSSGRSARSAHRLGRRASTGMGPEVNPVIVPIRPARRSNPGLSASGAPLVIRSFNRTSSSPTLTPNQTAPTKSYGETRESSERFSSVDVLKGASPPKFYNIITSCASFDGDDDIIGSDLEKSDSEITASTKTASERTSLSEKSENLDLNILVRQLIDPADVERRRSERELMSPHVSSRSMASQASHHDKVAEQSSSRHLRTFLKGSKRGYGQQANLDDDVSV